MKRTALILIFLFCIYSASSQTWERIYGIQNSPEAFQNFSESYDHGFYILGIKFFYPDTKGFVIKTDINGVPLYQVTLGIINEQMGIPVHITTANDGGAIICGEQDNFSPLGDISVIKLTACGDLEWCKIWRTDNLTDWGKEIHQLDDGGYIMMVQRNEEDTSHVWLYRMDMNGNPLWQHSYANYSQYPIISNVMDDFYLTSQDKYLLTGACWWCDSTEWCNLKAMTIQVDSSNSEDWVSAFNTEDPNFFSSSNSATQKESGNYYIGAANPIEGPVWVEYPPMLLVMDTLGNFLRDTLPQIPDIGSYYASGWLKDLLFLPDGRLYSSSDMVNDPDDYIGHFSLHELDSLGGWHNTFLRIGAHSYRSKTMLTSDGKILAGSVVGATAQQQDLILMKLNTSLQYDSIYTVPHVYDYLCPDTIVSKTIDLDCDIIVDVKDIPTREEYYSSIKLIPITPAPNPARNEVTFMMKNTEHHRDIRVVCYDIFGREMATVPVNAGTDEAEMNVSSWTSGMYVAVVYAGNKRVGSARFIVQK